MRRAVGDGVEGQMKDRVVAEGEGFLNENSNLWRVIRAGRWVER